MESKTPILDQCQRAIEEVLYSYSLNKQDDLLSRCRSVINKLNTVLVGSSTTDRKGATDLAAYVLQLYDSLKKKEPVLTAEEKLIWISSKVNGLFLFPDRWGTLFIDCMGSYTESRLQLPDTVNLKSWTRLNEMGKLCWSNDGIEDLYQDLAPNCSFVSSLLSASQNPNINLLDSIVPNAPSEKYGVKLFINGCNRIVMLDDTIPVLYESNTTLYVRSLSNDTLLWPTLLEKAYLNVLNNGYDHKGSNFGIDTYMLTGWLPNYSHIDHLTNSKIEALFDLFKDGNALVGIGAGSLTRQESEFYGVIPNHDYSIQDIIKNDDNSFTFLAKNPLLETSNRNRVFKIPNLQVFDILYVNINPAVFTSKKSLNFLYKPQTLTSNFLYECPQFTITRDQPGPITLRLCLERHLLSSEFENKDNFINVNIYATNGEKIWDSSYLRLHKGAENNSRFHTCVFELQDRYCTAVISYKSDSKRLACFTLRALSTEKFSISKSANKYNRILQVEDDWDHTNSFGNPRHRDYIKNPQYELNLRSSSTSEVNTNIALVSNDNPINLDLFIKEDDRFKFLTRYEQKNLVAHNASYQQGRVVYTDLKLNSNTNYILVVSTNEPVESKVPYKLLINYDDPDSGMNPVLNRVSTNLGLFTKTVIFENHKHRFKLSLSKQTLIQTRLTSISQLMAEYRSEVRIYIIQLEKNDKKLYFESSGEFLDNFYGTFFQEEMEPGDYVFAIDGLRKQIGGFELEVGASNKFALGDYI